MEDVRYVDLLYDVETISYESPICKKYQKILVFLYILLFLDIVFIVVAAPFGILAIFITIIFIVRLTKKLNRHLASVQEEIRLSGKMPEWWNERCKKYRKLSRLSPEKRMKISDDSMPNQVSIDESEITVKHTKAKKAVANTVAAYGLGKAASSAVKNASSVKKISKNSRTSDAMAIREKARAGQKLNRNQTKERITNKGKTYYITTMPNGNQVLTNVGNKRIGTYDKARNITIAENAKKVGNGNLLKTLI